MPTNRHQRSGGTPRWPVVAALSLFCSACALSGRPAEETLAERSAAPAGAGLLAEAERTQVELDRRANEALARARDAATPADQLPQLRLAATALLFQAADLRLQRATLAWLDTQDHPDVATVLTADDRLGGDVPQQIVSLCQAGLELADQAAEAQPDSPGARLHQGLHVSLLAWANGPARSLFAGFGPRLVRAIDAAIELDPTFDHGAPLRLQGRFRGKAPWPYGDLDVAKAALQRAVELGPFPVSHLFLGDVLWAAGEQQAARAEWTAAVTAEADESTRWSAPLLRELARRRLAAAGE